MARITGQVLIEGAVAVGVGVVDSFVERMEADARQKAGQAPAKPFQGIRDWARVAVAGGGLAAYAFSTGPQMLSMAQTAYHAGATLLGQSVADLVRDMQGAPASRYDAVAEAQRVAAARARSYASAPSLETEEEIPTLQ